MWLYRRPLTHRGLHNKKIPENSIASFENAIKHNYNIEIDIRTLRTGELVVFHDFTLLRMCKKPIPVSMLSLNDIKSDKYLLPNGEHIPLLNEVLEKVNGRTGLLIELKLELPKRKMEKKLYEMIKGKESWIAIQTFSPLSLSWFRKNAPEIHRGVLCGNLVLPITLITIKKMKPNFISYGVQNAGSSIVQNLLKKHHSKLITWTIRNKTGIDKAIKTNADNIIFEHVDLEKIGFDMSLLKN